MSNMMEYRIVVYRVAKDGYSDPSYTKENEVEVFKSTFVRAGGDVQVFRYILDAIYGDRPPCDCHLRDKEK